jgi:hypothetical protein
MVTMSNLVQKLENPLFGDNILEKIVKLITFPK